jgi:hypothetical protein
MNVTHIAGSMPTGSRSRSTTLFKKPQDARSCSFKPEDEVGGNRRTPKDLADRVGNKKLVVVKILSMQMRGKKGKENQF